MLTAREVGDTLGVESGAVRKWAREGRFKGARQEETAIGTFWLIPEDSLAGFERRKVGRPPKVKPKESSQKTRRRRNKRFHRS